MEDKEKTNPPSGDPKAEDLAGKGTVTGASSPAGLFAQTQEKLSRKGRPAGSRNKTSKDAPKPALSDAQVKARKDAAARMGKRLAVGPFTACAFVTDNPTWREALKQEQIESLTEDYVILAEVLGLEAMGKWTAIMSLGLNYADVFGQVRAEVRKQGDPIEQLVEKHAGAVHA